MTPAFWQGRRVFVTGHTGFKGTWLTRWLAMLGAEVTGYSLDDASQPPAGTPGVRRLAASTRDRRGDIGHLELLRAAMSDAHAEIVFHLAAQSLVRGSYADPLGTFTTNVLGTVHVLECLRSHAGPRVAIMITSDKCYENHGENRAFREDDTLGGSDPYSASKASAELAIAAYRESCAELPRIVAVRAGNVVGGGDWSADRLVPDLIRAFWTGESASIRLPNATRPWQFVLDALHGYLLAAEQAWKEDLPTAFNFGPQPSDAHTVRWLADAMAARWGDGAGWTHASDANAHHDAPTLALDATLAREVLGWRPLLDSQSTVDWTVEWYRSARDRTDDQLARFTAVAAA
jgi:CDP-glucose 4,6-dehydratase